MSPRAKREYIRAIVQRYVAASKAAKHQILTEVCATTGYHRKAAIRRLRQARGPPAHATAPPARTDLWRAHADGSRWDLGGAAGYPWVGAPQSPAAPVAALGHAALCHGGSMRSSLFTAEQVAQILKEAETGVAIIELCRRHGISQQTYSRWKAKYGETPGR